MSKNTVYIVGAGASCEVGLPTGDALKKIISMTLSVQTNICMEDYITDKEISNALEYLTFKEKDRVSEFQAYKDECRKISQNMSLAISIDNYIDTHRGNKKLELCGKLSIVKSILNAERGSKLYFEDSTAGYFDFNKLESTWYVPFFKTLTENCTVDELSSRLKYVTLIIFNYDRCIEHFLYNALKSYYNLSMERTIELLDLVTFVHPYGTVGTLPWQKTSKNEVVFGGELDSSRLVGFASEIRTFTEGGKSNGITILQNKMSITERVIFIGFAYHPLNMELLSSPLSDGYRTGTRPRCFATSYGASISDEELIEDSIKNLFERVEEVSVKAVTCDKLFQEYSRSLGYVN